LALAAADLAVCRSGASTCAEIMLTHKPSIMVPSPNVAEDHQTKNALSIERQGGCVLLPESEMKDGLVNAVSTLIASDSKLQAMAKSAGALAKPEAANEIAFDVVRIAESRIS
jgi:UDP-N-acetylglucosamine--N-acetylmuramyl-(pentapeptide) pyrophosphoryl-undecaprenol N-acetylglucosamine transferase